MASDLDPWQLYAQSVKKIATKSRARVKAQPKGLPPMKREHPLPLPPAILSSPEKSTVPPIINFSRQKEKDLRSGAIELDGRIDLHGLTQREAFDRLAHFMASSVKAGHRHLLVITGKGKNKQGVLRTHLSSWLTQLPEAGKILALRPAALKHGGDGAFYVVLKKNKRQSV